MPAAFNHPQGTELWTPVSLSPEQAARRDIGILRLVGRMKPGVSREDARVELAAIYQDLARRHPTDNAGTTPNVTQLGDAGDAKPLLAVLFAGVAFVLLIACANVANVLLADAASRRREMALRAAISASRSRVRVALGATRREIVAMVLRESLLMTGAGVAIGLTGALALSRYLATVLFEVPATDPVTYGTVAAGLLATGLAASWLPARTATGVDPVVALRSG